MQKNGYALVRDADGAELDWWEMIPPRIDVPGTTIVAFGADETWQSDEGYHLAPSTREFADPPDLDPTLPAPLAPITRRQLLLELKSRGLITAQEAIAAATSGVVPASVQAVFDLFPEADRDEAVITWATMSQAERGHPIVQALQAVWQYPDDELDALFRSALLR